MQSSCDVAVPLFFQRGVLFCVFNCVYFFCPKSSRRAQLLASIKSRSYGQVLEVNIGIIRDWSDYLLRLYIITWTHKISKQFTLVMKTISIRLYCKRTVFHNFCVRPPSLDVTDRHSWSQHLEQSFHKRSPQKRSENHHLKRALNTASTLRVNPPHPNKLTNLCFVCIDWLSPFLYARKWEWGVECDPGVVYECSERREGTR